MVSISQTQCPDKWPQKRVPDDTKTWHQTATRTNVPNHAQHEELRNRTDHTEGCRHEHGELCMYGSLRDDHQPERLTTDLSQMHKRGLQARRHPPQIMDQLFSIIVPRTCRANRNAATYQARATNFKRRDSVKN